ncbi:MAG TPA: hypothetical protein VJ986_10385 [Gaiellaceae bacterium]|nr:hypothetical protein [Gaiellaceae bacterium]
MIAELLALEPSTVSVDDEPVVLDDAGYDAWADGAVRRCRIRITSEALEGRHISIEIAKHEESGWFLVQRHELAGGRAVGLLPANARYLWRLILSALSAAVPAVSA